jgi:glyceraldehyde 3-phosphate dehydrogenase
MTVRIGLMGFGRIGRNIFRILAKRSDIEVGAIADLADPKALEYLLKYDSVLGRCSEPVALGDGNVLQVGSKKAKLFTGKTPDDVPWGELGCQLVIDCTGKPRRRADAAKHLDKGAKRVLLCVPTADADATVVVGVNHKDLTGQHKVIALGAISANCAAPIIKVLDEKFSIERLFYTAVHAYANDQRLADVPADDMRRSRAAAANIVPTEGQGVDTLTGLFPHLKDKVSAMSLRVPVPNGSLLDMVAFTKNPVSVQAVNDAVKAAAQGPYKAIVDYTTDPIVSSDVKGSAYSATFDASATMVLGNGAVKTVAWFDNGWGYAHRALELVSHLGNMQGGLS